MPTGSPHGARYHREIGTVMITGAIALGFNVAVAATASADPSAFSTLSCNCQETAPPGSPARKDEIIRGIRQGLPKWSPALPHQPSKAQAFSGTTFTALSPLRPEASAGISNAGTAPFTAAIAAFR